MNLSNVAAVASDIAQRGPFMDTERARRALRPLPQYGWVEPMEHGAEVGGKHRREAWQVIRAG